MKKNNTSEEAQRSRAEGVNLVNNGDLNGGLRQLNQALELYSSLDDK